MRSGPPGRMAVGSGHVTGPPSALVRTLVEGPSLVSGVEWHEQAVSTQQLAVAAARAGAPEIHVVLADVQSAGRGRHGREWHAPAGTSLLASVVLRPGLDARSVPLLSLLAGLAVAEVAERYCPRVSLKWPNDLLLDGRKAAGILAESAPDAAVALGMGINVDWRGVPRPPGVPEATSLAEAGGADVDRWRVLAALLGVFSRRYQEWQEQPTGFLDAYRRRCATIGRPVRVDQQAGAPIEGVAEAVAEDGALQVRDAAGGLRRLSAGDVEHVRSP